MASRHLATAFAIALLVSGCATPAPREPEAPPRRPIEIGPEGTAPILFEKVVYRIPAGTQIGAIFDRRRGNQTGEILYENSAISTTYYNISVTDRMRELGYQVVDLTDAVFEDESAVKARFRVVGVINRIDLSSYTHWRGREKNYQRGSVTMEVRLYDASVKDVVFTRAYAGRGFDKGIKPDALPGAVVDAMEAALADESFVSTVSAPPNGGSSVAAIVMPGCEAGSVQLPRDIAAVADAVVTIRLGSVLGSGVVISPAGYALTAAHLVAEGTHPVVMLRNGLELEAEVERLDKFADVALLKIPGNRHGCAPLNPARLPDVGTEAFAFGSPLDDRLAGTVTRGIVSGHPEIDGQELLQTDASVSPGSSGGPLVDAGGHVIGIVSSKAHGIGIEGVAFAVPAHVVRQRLAFDLAE